MVASTKTFSAMVASAALVAGVSAHGYMSDPAVTFLSTAGDQTQFIATIEASATGWEGTFGSSPSINTESFTTAFEASEYTSLKDVIESLATVTVDGASLTCGSCDPDETAQPMPEEYVEWSHSDSEGFTASHEGPCEVWCDDVRVFHEDDCAATYTTAPAELPFDRDACMGSSTLTFYWLALHSSTWQVYVNCAPLEATTSTGATSKYAVSGGSSGTSTATTGSSAASAASNSTSVDFSSNFATSASSDSETATSESAADDTTATTTTTTAPTATTAAPTTAPATEAPAATTEAPAAATDAPAAEASTDKCSVRRRRD